VIGITISIHKRAADPAKFVPFIRANVKGYDLQARILVRTGHQREALAIASGNRKLIEEINSYVQN
jgi:hypothetical protein